MFIRIPLLLAMILATGIPRAEAAELWDFIRVGKSFASGPKWVPKGGKGEVAFRGSKIELRVFDAADSGEAAPDQLGRETIRIVGTLGSDRTIQATCTFLETDANPLKITGRYISRDEVQTWGDKRKIVTQSEIVFPHPPNFEFFGFLRQFARDE
ncbi:hypothetical protein B5V03_21350 [Bradyrhizobium betae]|uniref:Uncharacterized protein n=1 Tax=Bradyrhizobium betae TaxID=244734 RepID=A0A4Q1V0S0_9BRAD|nr:hypothetical protein B5V03_21350 [Bradyrhizobium betae]